MNETTIPLIKPIEDIGFINHAIPGALLISDSDEAFTIRQANQGYFDLIGYTREEVAEQFANQGTRTLHPDDIADALHTFAQQVKTNEGRRFSIKARLVNKSNGYVWVQFSGCWDAKSDQICILLVDISEQQEALEKLKSERDFNALVGTLSEDAFFDCDILYGTMRYSPNFAARFGLNEIIRQYPSELLEKNLIAPDSLHFYENRFLDEVYGVAEEELHMLLPTGEDAWYLCRYQVFHDALGIPIRAVGKLSNITEQKNRMQELSHKAERDPLTGLFNKRATELLIIEHLEKSDPDEEHALLLIDVDNFKEINDRLGHLYGDLVLTQLAEDLKRCFRSEDVIGRIGGDEFFVFLPNCSQGPILEERAGAVCKIFRKTLQEKQERVSISASVGIACWPEHGESFQELYKTADIALYTVKQRGKDGFAVYDGAEQPIYEGKRTEIDNRGRVQKSFESNRLEYVFQLLYQAKDVERAIRLVLQLVGEHFGYSRAYIMEYSEDGCWANNTFEWCAEEVTPQLPFLQHVPTTLGKTIDEALAKQGHFVMHTLADLPPNEEREVIAKQGILSMLHVAIHNGDQLVGSVGFDDCTQERVISPQEQDELHTICDLLGTFLLKHRALESAKRYNAYLLSLIDQLQGEVCVIDYESRQILYENAAARRLGLAHSVGELCYAAYAARDTICEDCPLSALSEAQPLVKAQVRHGSELPRDAAVRFVEWVRGERACLVHLAEPKAKE